MTELEILELARSLGFEAAALAPEEIPLDPSLRDLCQENQCGNYGANHSCPPDCGTVEELSRKLLAEETALVTATHWVVEDWTNGESIVEAQRSHHAASWELLAALAERGYDGFLVGSGGCSLCMPCKRKLGEPCSQPERRLTGMSAYCVDVGKLAKKCGMKFDWVPGQLFLYSMVLFHKREAGA